jgi:hypothetical protein
MVGTSGIGAGADADGSGGGTGTRGETGTGGGTGAAAPDAHHVGPAAGAVGLGSLESPVHHGTGGSAGTRIALRQAGQVISVPALSGAGFSNWSHVVQWSWIGTGPPPTRNAVVPASGTPASRNPPENCYSSRISGTSVVNDIFGKLGRFVAM